MVALILNYENIPGAFLLIIDSALSGQAAVGGFAGSTVAYAVRFGICSLTGLVIVLFCVPCGYRYRYQCSGLSKGGYISRGYLAVL